MNKNAWLFVGLVSLVLIAATGCGPGTLVPPTAEPATEAPGPATQEPAEAGGEPTSEAGSGLPVFRLVPEETEARFLIDEILANQPKTVVGATNAVEGSLVPDFATPSNTTVGLVRVDMSTLITDSEFRNRAIHTAILQTGDEGFRYAEFEMTALTGLPEEVVIGEPFNFQLVGNMSIHGVTQELTFDVTATAVSETRIEGTATTQPILYTDFGINILRLPPQVASVEDDLILELEFVAEVE
jgi:polyisoprenoid-binding protein YceI